MSLTRLALSQCVRARWLSCTSLPYPLFHPHHGGQRLRRLSPHRHLTSTVAPNPTAPANNSISTAPPHPSQSPFAAVSQPSSASPPPSVSTQTRRTSSPALPSPDQLRTALQYCIDQVQRTDPTAYLAIIFAPASLRPALFTLRALWLELSRVRQSTSDARIASMKLSWWNTTIKQLYTQPHAPPQSQPVVLVLHYLTQRHSLTQRLFSRLVQAKLEDVEYAPPSTIAELDAYNESTYSSLLYLALQCAPGQQASVHADHVASHVGKAIGLTRMLQSLPAHAREQRCYIPTSIMQQCKVDEQAVYRGEAGEAVREAVYELASNAKAHIGHARTHCSGLSKAQVSVMMDVVGVERWLDRLEEVNFDVFNPRLVDMERHGWEPLKLRWALWNHARKGTF